MTAIEFYSDRTPVTHVAVSVIDTLREHGLGRTLEKATVHFCGMVVTPEGKTCMFLPRNIHAETEVNARLTMRSLAKFGAENSNRENLDSGSQMNTGYLATIANIAHDFRSNGLYLERTRKQTRNRGKIDWQRTIARESGAISEQGPIYTDFITTVGSNNSANILADIQALAIKEIASIHGWWIPDISSRKGEILNMNALVKDSRRHLIKQLEKNLASLFSIRAIRLSNWLIAYLKQDRGASTGAYIFGVHDFHSVWEVMLRSTLAHVEQGWNSKLARPAYWTKSGDVSEAANRGLRTDIIVRHKTGHAVIDAKYYTASHASNAPSIGDFAKQILYETVLREELGENDTIRNMFVFPAPANGEGPLSEMFMLKRDGLTAMSIPTVECKYLSVSQVMQAYCQNQTLPDLNNALGLA